MNELQITIRSPTYVRTYNWNELGEAHQYITHLYHTFTYNTLTHIYFHTSYTYVNTFTCIFIIIIYISTLLGPNSSQISVDFKLTSLCPLRELSLTEEEQCFQRKTSRLAAVRERRNSHHRRHAPSCGSALQPVNKRVS